MEMDRVDVTVEKSNCEDLSFEKNMVQEILDDCMSQDNSNQRGILSRLEAVQEIIPNNNNISILSENLILTSAASVNSQTIEALDITCVISAAAELPLPPLGCHIMCHKVDVMDSEFSDISTYFDETADLIAQSSLGGRALVFCVAGVSRSASICIAYLMKYHGLTLREAYNYVKLRRPKIHPNCGFFKQLIEYEEKLYGRSTVNIVFNEIVQTHIPDVYDDEYRAVRSFLQKRRDRHGRHK